MNICRLEKFDPEFSVWNRMKRLTTMLALLISMSALGEDGVEDPVAKANSDVQAGRYMFLSWYNGWTRHDVWGIGAVMAAYSNGAVDCGGRSVRLVPVYDSHADMRAPKWNQTKAYVQSYNHAVLKLLEANGITCDFELIDETRLTRRLSGRRWRELYC